MVSVAGFPEDELMCTQLGVAMAVTSPALLEGLGKNAKQGSLAQKEALATERPGPSLVKSLGSC